MVAKVLGLASGALVASVAVWAFNDWRHVSDADRLAATLADNCLPFVRTGVTPFSDIGRPIGVYDNANLSENITGGGARILFDNRFIAQWGNSTDVDSPVQVCQVNYTYVNAASPGFEIQTDTVIDTITTLIGPDMVMIDGQDTLETLPVILGWTDATATANSGLRVFITVQDGGVSGVLVVQDSAP